MVAKIEHEPSTNVFEKQDGEAAEKSPAFTIIHYVDDILVLRYIPPFGLPTGADLDSRRGLPPRTSPLPPSKIDPKPCHCCGRN